jgi:ankyrin repeat protein
MKDNNFNTAADSEFNLVDSHVVSLPEDLQTVSREERQKLFALAVDTTVQMIVYQGGWLHRGPLLESVREKVTDRNIAAVKRLIDAKVNINVLTRRHPSRSHSCAKVFPLNLAIRRRNFKMVQYLLEAKADVNKTCLTAPMPPLIEAVNMLYGEAVDEAEKIIYLLIKANANVNSKSGSYPYLTALAEVVTKAHPGAALRALLEAKADVNTDHREGMDALSSALGSGASVSTVRALLDAKAGVCEEGYMGKPLSMAVAHSTLEVFQLLHERGFGLDETASVTSVFSGMPGDSTFEAAAAPLLCMAAYAGKTDIVRFLVKKKAVLEEGDGEYSPLAYAAKRGSEPTVALLLEAGARVNAVNSGRGTALLVAVSTVDLNPAIVATLLAAKALVNKVSCGVSPLHFLLAFSSDLELGSPDHNVGEQLQTLELLLSAKADLDAIVSGEGPYCRGGYYLSGYCGLPALGIAALRGLFSQLLLLIDVGVTVNYTLCEDPDLVEHSQPALMAALSHNNKDERSVHMVESLVQAKADVNQGDGVGSSTPLHLATEQSFSEVVRILLEAKASATELNAAGETPLQIARRNNYSNVMTALIKAGAVVNPSAFLLVAIRCYTAKVAVEVIRRGADLFQKDGDGNTALHVAAELNKVGVLKHLLRAKASVEEENLLGQRPVDLAEKQAGCTGSFKLLFGLTEVKPKAADAYEATDSDGYEAPNSVAGACDFTGWSPLDQDYQKFLLHRTTLSSSDESGSELDPGTDSSTESGAPSHKKPITRWPPSP